MADSSNYPAALDGELDDIVPDATQPIGLKDYLKLLGDAVARIQETLGVDPQGAEADLVTRLAAFRTEDQIWGIVNAGTLDLAARVDVLEAGGGGGGGGGSSPFELVVPIWQAEGGWTHTTKNTHWSRSVFDASQYPDAASIKYRVILQLLSDDDVTIHSSIWTAEEDSIAESAVSADFTTQWAFAMVESEDLKEVLHQGPRLYAPEFWTSAGTAGIFNASFVVEMPASEVVDGGDSDLLVLVAYEPDDMGTYSVSSGTLDELDTTNLRVTFTVPDDGVVSIELEGMVDVAASTEISWGLMEGGSEVVGPVNVVYNANSATIQTTIRRTFVIAGLTPGETLTYDWAAARTFGAGVLNMYVGGTKGAGVMRVTGTALAAEPVPEPAASGGGVLAITTLNPDDYEAPEASTTLEDVDARLAVTFTAPESGQVIVQLSAYARPTGSSMLSWGLRDSNDVEVVAPVAIQVEATSPGLRHQMTIVVPGLTPGNQYTWKWTHVVDTGTGNTFFGGITGQANMIVTDASLPTLPTYVEAVLIDEPLGFWMLDETGGSTAADLSGNDRDGTYVNSTSTSDGPAGQRARTFAGDGQVETPATPFRTAAFTAEAWVRTSNADWMSILAHPASSSGPYGYNLFVSDSSGVLRGEFDNGGPQDRASDTNIADGEWHHVVMTGDGTTIRLFVDAVEENNVSQGAALEYLSGAEELYIGAMPTNTTEYYFTGDIAAVALYDHAITPARVTAHYNAIGEVEVTLLAEYTFVDGDTTGWTVSSTWSENPADWITAGGDGSGQTFLRRALPAGCTYAETTCYVPVTAGSEWLCLRIEDTLGAIYDSTAHGVLLRGTANIAIPWSGGSDASIGAGDTVSPAPNTQPDKVVLGIGVEGTTVTAWADGVLYKTYTGVTTRNGGNLTIGCYNGANGHFESVRCYDRNPNL